MPKIPRKAQTTGSTSFDPEKYFDAWGRGEIGPPREPENNFRQFIISTFGIQPTDTFTYAAVAEVTLAQAQMHVDAGPRAGRHAWYRDSDDKPLDPPPADDVAVYINIFKSSTSTHKALVAMSSNAKKGSIRASVASHLQSLYQPPSPSHNIIIPKLKKEPVNPYFDVWAWSCQTLKWAGPDESTKNIRFSHGILPVLYHHFGCVCPSFESLCIISQLAQGRNILDVGSGNGYWTYMLRRFDVRSPMKVVPIDNGISEWRTMWVGDTQQIDGVEYLKRHSGGKDDVLLLVYPQVGLEFTSKILHAYKGDTIICAGTQNANGYTAFAGESIADWIAREMPEYGAVCQIPLPSFAGKDEALFAFQKQPI